MSDGSLHLTIHPLTPDRWRDFEALFGPKGACAGCWCMWWKRSQKEFDAEAGEGNRQLMQGLVSSGVVPGLLAYAGDETVGWCAIEPRAAYSRLARSWVLAPVDDQPVWSVTCFFVKRGWRRKGVTRALLIGAIEHAGRHGGQIVEGYPVEPRTEKTSDVFVYTGLASTFRAVGFEEVARRSETRPIMRYNLESTESTESTKKR